MNFHLRFSFEYFSGKICAPSIKTFEERLSVNSNPFIYFCIKRENMWWQFQNICHPICKSKFSLYFYFKCINNAVFISFVFYFLIPVKREVMWSPSNGHIFFFLEFFISWLDESEMRVCGKIKCYFCFKTKSCVCV